MASHSFRYVIVSAVRDEERYIEGTILCVVSQTVRPAEWVIVDDGSTDDTAKIIERYAREIPWIRSVCRRDRGTRLPGTGVIDAFDEGYRSLTYPNWEFLVKLDGDLEFEEDYLEKCLQRFVNNPKLGIGGGMIYHVLSGQPKLEKVPRFHVRGATKIYRKKCWDDIGGLVKAPGWDTIDEVKSHMLGWTTESFPEIRVIHRRFTGAAAGWWANSLKNGRANYLCGYHPLFMILKCIRRIFKRPYLVDSVGLICGFLGGYVNNEPQIEDRAFNEYLRKQQVRRLIRFKTIWH